MYYLHQADFSRGEISPLLGSRNNVDFWSQSLFLCRNFNVLTHGGLRRRSGTVFVAECADINKKSRLFPFIFSEEQAYVLEFNGKASGNLRFLALRGLLYSGASPYAITHPYAEDKLNRLSYVQINDVAYIANRSYYPRKLSRMGDIDWSIALHELKNGPYLPVDTKGTILTPASTGHITPAMTGLTTPSGTVSSSSGTAAAWRVFDRDRTEEITIDNASSGWVQYQFASSAKRVADAYWITSPDNSPSDMFTEWEFQGSNDGTNFTTLDSRSGEVGWGSSETRYFDFLNETAFEYYRLTFRGGGGENAADTTISEIAIHQAAEDQTPFDLTASSLAGINSGDGFQSSDVGRSIRVMGGDGRWRWLKITSVTSTSVVKVQMHGHALPDLSPFSRWQLGAIAEDTGYPNAVTLYNERVFFAGTEAKPTTVYGSKQGIFDDFGASDPVTETDGLNLTLLSSRMNEITWLADDVNLVAGSAGELRSIGPADQTSGFSAVNLQQFKGPTSGASRIQPLSIGGVILYVGAGGTKIRELVLGEQARYVAPELSLIGEHYFKSGIVDWAFAERPDPTIYAVTADGLLCAITYDREQRVVGFARHDFGGKVESVAVIPSADAGYDDVYMVVNRTINTEGKRYIEVMERPFDGDIDVVAGAFHVDCGLRYSGAAISTVTGLGHLEGETVVALADGNVIRDLVVEGGQVDLGFEAKAISIGLPYTSRAITLPIAGPQQDGTLFGRRRKAMGFSIDVLNSGAVKVGSYSPADMGSDEAFCLEEQLFNTGDAIFGNEVQLHTGFRKCQFDGSWADGDAQIVMETDEPLPLLIRSAVLHLEGEP